MACGPSWGPVRLAALPASLELQVLASASEGVHAYSYEQSIKLELTEGSPATACFQMSAQLQSQTSSCQTIVEWQFQLSSANAPPRGPGFWSMPPAIISHSEFKPLMTAHESLSTTTKKKNQPHDSSDPDLLQANPVTTLSRAAR